MIRLKPGVRLTGLRPELVLALLVAERIYDAAGVERMVVTSISDGRHSRGSLHYKGLACDLRTHNVPAAKRAWIVGELKAALGPDFDVVHEAVGKANEHIHVEADPKGPR